VRWHAGEQSRELCALLAMVLDIVGKRRFQRGSRRLHFGQGPLQQSARAIADVAAHHLLVHGREAVKLANMIGARGNVWQGVGQCAVEIEQDCGLGGHPIDILQAPS
jgi:hypothetical protein